MKLATMIDPARMVRLDRKASLTETLDRLAESLGHQSAGERELLRRAAQEQLPSQANEVAIIQYLVSEKAAPDGTVVALAVSPLGIPVPGPSPSTSPTIRALFLVESPQHLALDHARVVARLARLFTGKEFLAKALRCTTNQDLFRVVSEEDHDHR